MKNYLKDAELIGLYLGLKIDYRQIDPNGTFLHSIRFIHKDFKHFKISMSVDYKSKDMFTFNAFCYGFVGRVNLTCKTSKKRTHESIAQDVQKKIIDKIPEFEKKYIDYLQKVKEGIEEKKIKDNLIKKVVGVGNENVSYQKYNNYTSYKKNDFNFTLEDHYNDANYKLTFDSLTIEQVLKILTIL